MRYHSSREVTVRVFDVDVDDWDDVNVDIVL